MKKMLILIGAVALFTGCDTSDGSYDKKEVSVNGSFFGERKDKGYENGYKLYSKKGELVGFIDTDNIVYQNNIENGYCGGVWIGLCETTGDNTCNVPNFESVTYDESGNIELIPPYISNSCGERL